MDSVTRECDGVARKSENLCGMSTGSHGIDGNGGEHAVTAQPSYSAPAPASDGPFKLFIGGLNRNTSSQDLRTHFERFGTLVEAAVVCDKDTGKSRGFGFCTYERKDGMQAALDESHHLDGTDIRVALPKDDIRGGSTEQCEVQPGRVFVGGLSDEVTEESFREYFSKYGKLTSSTVMYDKDSNRPRGFGFLIFDDPADATRSLGPHTSLGRACEAKPAQPRPTRRRSPGRDSRHTRRGPRYDDPYYGDSVYHYGGGYGGGPMRGGYCVPGGYGGFGGYPPPAYGYGGGGYGGAYPSSSVGAPPEGSGHYGDPSRWGGGGGGGVMYDSRSRDYVPENRDEYGHNRPSNIKTNRRANPY